MTKQTVATWLIATVFVVVASKTIIPLNGPCSRQTLSDTSCGENAFCSSLTGRCECTLGTLSAGPTDCQSMTCFTKKMCTGTFGNDTTCYVPGWSGYCVSIVVKNQHFLLSLFFFTHLFFLQGCDASFQVNPSTQICEPIKSALNGNCNTDSQCGQNAVCKGGHCACAFPNAPSVWNNVNCDQLFCLTDEQCERQFGGNTVCDVNYRICRCKPGSTLNPVTQTCVTSIIY